MALVNLSPPDTLLDFFHSSFKEPEEYGDEPHWIRLIQTLVVFLARSYSPFCLGALKLSWYLHRFKATADFYNQEPKEIGHFAEKLMNDDDIEMTSITKDLLQRLLKCKTMDAIEAVLSQIDQEYSLDTLVSPRNE